MNLERAIRRASTVPGRKSAARLYNEIEYELALGEPSDPLEAAGEQALALLEGRFPGVREAAREIEQPPSLSRQATDALYGMSRTRRSGWPARRSERHADERVRPLRSWLFLNGRAHPVAAIATVTVSTIVIVRFWAFIVLAVIALAALKASRARRTARAEKSRIESLGCLGQSLSRIALITGMLVEVVGRARPRKLGGR